MTATCDRCEIQQILGKVSLVSDLDDLEDLRHLYAPDAIWTSGEETRDGVEAIIRGIGKFRIAGMTGPGSNAIHFSMSLSITVSGEEAEAISHFALVTGKSHPRSMPSVGTYFDQLKRTDAGWRIVRRRMELLS